MHVAERVYTKDVMEQSVTAELTSRQQQVLRLVARGRSNREIAGELGITEQGVKSHVSRLLLRHGVPNRTALVAATQSWGGHSNGATNGHSNGATNGHGNGGGDATDRLRREPSIETVRPHAAGLSSDTPALALTRLRDIVRELNVALEFARELPPGESSKVLVKAVSTRVAEAEKQLALLEGAIAAA